jgi:GT2 family glycosyltransferase
LTEKKQIDLNVYIIIVTYNGMKWLPKSLASIKKTSSVIVVDNNSSDNTVKFIQKTYREFILIPLNENLGFGRANNIGISKALNLGAEAVFLMNQDVYLRDDVILDLSRILKKHPKFGVVSPMHLNGKGDLLDKDFAKYCLANTKIYLSKLNKENNKQNFNVPFVNAAAWLISKECLEKVGGFDPVFFHYGEDENYCQRVRYHGFSIMIHVNSFIMHDTLDLKSQSTSKYSKRDILNFKKFLFLKYANLNQDFSDIKYNHEFQKICKNLFKSSFKLNYNGIKGNFEKIKILFFLKKEIKRSRSQNSELGKHYLN